MHGIKDPSWPGPFSLSLADSSSCNSVWPGDCHVLLILLSLNIWFLCLQCTPSLSPLAVPNGSFFFLLPQMVPLMGREPLQILPDGVQAAKQRPGMLSYYMVTSLVRNTRYCVCLVLEMSLELWWAAGRPGGLLIITPLALDLEHSGNPANVPGRNHSIDQSTFQEIMRHPRSWGRGVSCQIWASLDKPFTERVLSFD